MISHALTRFCVEFWPILSFRYVLAMSSARIRYSAVFFFTASLLRGLTSPDTHTHTQSQACGNKKNI